MDTMISPFNVVLSTLTPSLSTLTSSLIFFRSQRTTARWVKAGELPTAHLLLALLQWIVTDIGVFRFLAGLTSSATFNVAPMYIGECSEAPYRGFLISTFFTVMMVGTLISYAIVTITDLWVSATIGAVVNGLHILLFILMPETPYYYFMKEKKTEAEKSLRYVQQNQNELKLFLLF